MSKKDNDGKKEKNAQKHKLNYNKRVKYEMSDEAKEYERQIIEKLYQPRESSGNAMGDYFLKAGSNVLASVVARNSYGQDYDPKRQVQVIKQGKDQPKQKEDYVLDAPQVLEHKYVVGITGNTGSGKSLIGQYMRDLGYEVLDADAITHQLQQKGERGYEAIVAEFGPGYLDEQGQINRKLLGDYVFGDAKAKQRLEDALHPLIVETIAKLAEQSSTDIVFIEAPLLYEAGANSMCDEVWAVLADDETRKQRIMQRDGIDEAQAKARMDAQGSQQKKALHADAVIDNNANTNKLYDSVDRIFGHTKRRMGNKLNADQS
ncbi:dephospho-CoA kinase [Eubacteriales bacterium OttesenSCG-928-N14]|nr:dephospho-CoA kinase [Eubacteriales bacterium OttesenSCG-928-N14]